MSGSGVMRELNRSQKTEVGFRAAAAAIQNERLTRERVERLERAAPITERRLRALEDLGAREFWGRLRWLLLGR